MILQAIVYLRFSIYSCFLFIVHNKEKTFILFLGDISPIPPCSAYYLGDIYILSISLSWALPGVFTYMGSLRSPNTCPHIKPLYGANGAMWMYPSALRGARGLWGMYPPGEPLGFPMLSPW